MDEFVDNLLGDMDAAVQTWTGNPFAHEGDREITLRFDFVICADGAVYVRNRSKLVDVLLIDGFNQDGQARQLRSAEFYAHCHAKLRKGGVLVVKGNRFSAFGDQGERPYP